MKTIYAAGKYKVSFNDCFGEYEVGDSCMGTVDYAGNNIAELASEVIADQLEDGFLLEFKWVEDKVVMGIFFEPGEQEWPIAIMYKD